MHQFCIATLLEVVLEDKMGKSLRPGASCNLENIATIWTFVLYVSTDAHCMRTIIGASLSEPHIDEFAVEVLSLYIYII